MSETNTSEQTSCKGSGCVCGGRGPVVSQMMQAMMPVEAGEHFRNAGVELLKGFRELLDLQIQALSPTESKGTKLNVD